MKKSLFYLPTGITLSLFAAAPTWADAAKGETYFSSLNGGNCYSCHYVDNRKLVGPGLKKATQRHSEDWLKTFLADPQVTWKSDHPETLELKKRVRKTRAPSTTCMKGHMTAEQIQDMIDYLNVLGQ